MTAGLSRSAGARGKDELPPPLLLAHLRYDALGDETIVEVVLEDAAAKAPRMAGVVALTRDRALRVVREAQRRPLGAEGRTAILTESLAASLRVALG